MLAVCRMSSRGAFIVLEGLDRSGKSTQAEKLVDYLREQGKDVDHIRFPDRQEPFGRVIDAFLKRQVEISSPQAMHLAFSLNRWQKAASIRERVAAGAFVVADRYCYSGVAYSIAGGLDEKWVKQADIGLPRPDLVLFFAVDAAVAASRGGFGDERLEDPQLQKRVAEEMNKLSGGEEWKGVNASAAVEEVAEEVRGLVEGLRLSGELGSLTRL